MPKKEPGGENAIHCDPVLRAARLRNVRFTSQNEGQRTTGTTLRWDRGYLDFYHDG
jgi:hypothetical protein